MSQFYYKSREIFTDLKTGIVKGDFPFVYTSQVDTSEVTSNYDD